MGGGVINQAGGRAGRFLLKECCSVGGREQGGGAPPKPKQKKEEKLWGAHFKLFSIYSMRYLANSNRKSSLIIFVS